MSVVCRVMGWAHGAGAERVDVTVGSAGVLVSAHTSPRGGLGTGAERAACCMGLGRSGGGVLLHGPGTVGGPSGCVDEATSATV